MRILIYGAGVQGSVYGGLLARCGHNVTFLARGPRAVQLAQGGLFLQGALGDRDVRLSRLALVDRLEPQDGRKVHTNTLEGFFSVFKRGMVGIYQHCSEAHLDRYLAEFDFRQNNREKLGISDVSRASTALQGVKGKRLTYTATVAA
jgi:hypothetical protein